MKIRNNRPKSKYNRIVSIDIDSLTEEQLKKAIPEWAEGSEELESLLWTCHNNGIKTDSCHILKNINGYIDFLVEESEEDICRMFENIQDEKNAMIVLSPDGGNPFGGTNWYKPIVGVAAESNITEIIEILNDTINNKKPLDSKKGNFYKEALNFFNFFKRKESGISSIYAGHNQEDKYIFMMSGFKNDMEYEYLNELFKEVGLEKKENKRDSYKMIWGLEDENPDQLTQKLEKIREKIEEKWNLGLPEKIDDKMGVTRRALIKRREFGDTPIGKKKMNLWLKAAKIVSRNKLLMKHYKKKCIMAINMEDGAKKLEEAKRKLAKGEKEDKEK